MTSAVRTPSTAASPLALGALAAGPAGPPAPNKSRDRTAGASIGAAGGVAPRSGPERTRRADRDDEDRTGPEGGSQADAFAAVMASVLTTTAVDHPRGVRPTPRTVDRTADTQPDPLTTTGSVPLADQAASGRRGDPFTNVGSSPGSDGNDGAADPDAQTVVTAGPLGSLDAPPTGQTEPTGSPTAGLADPSGDLHGGTIDLTGTAQPSTTQASPVTGPGTDDRSMTPSATATTAATTPTAPGRAERAPADQGSTSDPAATGNSIQQLALIGGTTDSTDLTDKTDLTNSTDLTDKTDLTGGADGHRNSAAASDVEPTSGPSTEQSAGTSTAAVTGHAQPSRRSTGGDGDGPDSPGPDSPGADTALTASAAVTPPVAGAAGSDESPGGRTLQTDQTVGGVGPTSGPAHRAEAAVTTEILTTPAAASPPPAATPAGQVAAAVRSLRAAQGTHHLSLELHPADLGALSIEVMVNQGTVHLSMRADRAETGRLLSGSLDELRAALNDAGLTAGQLDVGQRGSGRQAPAFQLPDAPGTDRSGERRGDLRTAVASATSPMIRRNRPTDSAIDLSL